MKKTLPVHFEWLSSIIGDEIIVAQMRMRLSNLGKVFQVSNNYTVQCMECLDEFRIHLEKSHFALAKLVKMMLRYSAEAYVPSPSCAAEMPPFSEGDMPF